MKIVTMPSETQRRLLAANEFLDARAARCANTHRSGYGKSDSGRLRKKITTCRHNRPPSNKRSKEGRTAKFGYRGRWSSEESEGSRRNQPAIGALARGDNGYLS